LLVGVLLGCGGGGGVVPPAGDTGRVIGRIVNTTDPTQFTVLVDGQPVEGRPSPSGDFNVPGVPAGNHTIGVVGPGGVQGAYVPAPVRPGKGTNVGDVEPELCGGISGMVTKVDESGNEEAVVGVEVIATQAVNWSPPDPGEDGEPVPIGRTGDPEQIVISAFTDEFGAYIMKPVPPGSYDVTVVVPGYDPQFTWLEVYGGDMAVWNVTVYPAPEQGVGTVEGTVTGESEGPLEGAMVTLTTGSPWPVPLPMEAVESWLDARPGGGGVAPCNDETGCVVPPWIEVQVFNTLTDAQGHYSLNVPIGNHFIESWLDGWNWQGQDVTIEKDQTTTVDFQLTKWVDEPPLPDPGDPGDPTDPPEPNRPPASGGIR
jgi:hypothetical protein